MRHRIFAPALGALAAVVLAAGVPSYASAADPSGIWAKDDGSAKMEVKKCGRGICSKIVWLREPNDSRGKPLHDVRNENPSMRDRPIVGLPLFSNMVATESNAWVGNVYNPEEGKTYTDVKVTYASRNQIVLKGCKAWLLCGEKMWTRSTLPASAPAEPAEEIEVKTPVTPAEPAQPAAPDAQKPIEAEAPAKEPAPAPVMEAAREPIAEPPAPKPVTEAFTVGTPNVEERVSVAPPKIKMKSASPASSQDNAIGPGLVTTPTSHPEPLPLSGESVPSMMVMSNPAPIAATPEPKATEAKVEAVEQDQAAPAPAPAAKPKPKPKTLSADASESASAGSVPHVVKPKPKPKEPEEVLPWLRPRY
jgi:uncharacterized protein (DUF2147 family)